MTWDGKFQPSSHMEKNDALFQATSRALGWVQRSPSLITRHPYCLRVLSVFRNCGQKLKTPKKYIVICITKHVSLHKHIKSLWPLFPPCDGRLVACDPREGRWHSCVRPGQPASEGDALGLSKSGCQGFTACGAPVCPQCAPHPLLPTPLSSQPGPSAPPASTRVPCDGHRRPE